MIHAPRRRPRRRQGVAAVELALTLPLIVLLLLGIWEVGRIVQVSQVLHNAAREGARQASTGTVSLDQIKANVRTYIQNAEPSITDLTGYDVQFKDITDPTVTDPLYATQLDRFTVTVIIPYDNVRVGLLTRVTALTTVSASVDWYSMRDLPVEVTTTLPVD